MKKTIKIDGMGCEHCIKSVKDALGEIKDLKILEVKIGKVEVEIKDELEEKVTEEIVKKLDEAGYDTI